MNTYVGKGRTPREAMQNAYADIMERRHDQNGIISHSFTKTFWGVWYCVLVA